jgi:hypothetical protein
MIAWAVPQPIPSKPHAGLIVALASSTAISKRSKSSVNRPPGSAHGTRIVRTPCSGQWARGTCARIRVSNCIVSRGRQVCPAAVSWIKQARWHSGQQPIDTPRRSSAGSLPTSSTW